MESRNGAWSFPLLSASKTLTQEGIGVSVIGVGTALSGRGTACGEERYFKAYATSSSILSATTLFPYSECTYTQEVLIRGHRAAPCSGRAAPLGCLSLPSSHPTRHFQTARRLNRAEAEGTLQLLQVHEPHRHVRRPGHRLLLEPPTTTHPTSRTHVRQFQHSNSIKEAHGI